MACLFCSVTLAPECWVDLAIPASRAPLPQEAGDGLKNRGIGRLSSILPPQDACLLHLLLGQQRFLLIQASGHLFIRSGKGRPEF